MHGIAVAALAAMTFSFTAHAGDVFVTRDAQGNPVFTIGRKACRRRR